MLEVLTGWYNDFDTKQGVTLNSIDNYVYIAINIIFQNGEALTIDFTWVFKCGVSDINWHVASW